MSGECARRAPGIQAAPPRPGRAYWGGCGSFHSIGVPPAPAARSLVQGVPVVREHLLYLVPGTVGQQPELCGVLVLVVVLAEFA